jgi:tetratricopeptide (TPR) repeat protein
MGQAEYLKKEYERCANTFKFIVDKYHPENVAKELAKLKAKKKKKKKKKRRKKKRRRKKKKKKKKKVEEEEEKPIVYGVKHRPIRYAAMLWLAKSYIELDRYDDAGYYLRQLENDLKVPYKLRPLIQAAIAYSWTKQKEYEQAIIPLENAIKFTRKKSIKNRYVYLLAQIYQMQGNSQLAMENFHKILRLKPSYEMEFNARLNMVKNAASATGKKVINPEIALKKMLRDSKNEEYKDQIYFALAQLQLNKGNTPEGIALIEQSLVYSQSGAQRTEGCLLLAELYYKQDNYVKSYTYYDSTMMVIQEDDDRYVTADIYKRKLQGVASHLMVVNDKDSMRIVGNWERKEQESWAIAGMEMDERRQANAPKPMANATPSKGGRKFNMNSISMNEVSGGPGRRPGGTSNGKITLSDNALQKSKFALYNVNLKKKGEREFEKRWGNRSWVDNWRQSDKGDEDTELDEAETLAKVPKTQSEIDAYLKKKGVPMSDQDKKALEDKLGEAMFKAAEHYREDLGRDDKALELVESLVRTYPQNPFAVEAMFLAYNIFSEDNNTRKITFYKNEILTKYPQSNIAKVLSDPDFANSEKIKYDRINKYYDDTYVLIQQGQASEALKKVRAVSEEFGKNYEMKARFALLEAMCMGGIKGEKDYVKALRVIVTSFPETKEEKQAKAMIAILNKSAQNKPVAPIDEFLNKDNLSLFQANKRIKHLVLVVFDNKKSKVNQYRAPITEFNNKNYMSSRLSTSSILVDGSTPSLTIRAFPNGDLAMKYVVDARSNKAFLSGVKGFQIYAISQQNYNLALSTQKFHLYKAFFEKNYR